MAFNFINNNKIKNLYLKFSNFAKKTQSRSLCNQMISLFISLLFIMIHMSILEIQNLKKMTLKLKEFNVLKFKHMSYKKIALNNAY